MAAEFRNLRNVNGVVLLHLLAKWTFLLPQVFDKTVETSVCLLKVSRLQHLLLIVNSKAKAEMNVSKNLDVTVDLFRSFGFIIYPQGSVLAPKKK